MDDGDVEMAVCDAADHPAPKRKATKPTTAAAKKKESHGGMTKSPIGKAHIALHEENRNRHDPIHFSLGFDAAFSRC